MGGRVADVVVGGRAGGLLGGWILLCGGGQSLLQLQAREPGVGLGARPGWLGGWGQAPVETLPLAAPPARRAPRRPGRRRAARPGERGAT